MAFESVIYPSKKKFLAISGFGLFVWLVGATVLIILINLKKFDDYVVLGFWFSMIPFYIFLFYRVIINPKPIMVINSDGLFTSFYGMIYWIEIEKLYLRYSRGGEFLAVILKNKEKIISRLKSYKIFFIKAKVFYFHGISPVEFNITLLPMSVEQLFLEMGKFHEAANGWLQEKKGSGLEC